MVCGKAEQTSSKEPTNMPLICYAYDPLDRLTKASIDAQPPTQRFYNHERLSTIRKGEHRQTVFQHRDLLLAEKRTSETLLMGTDLQRSVLHSLSGAHHYPRAYTPYGHQGGQQGLLGFNGETSDPLTGHYLLGNGHRAYNPVLMRFNSPDTLSPFGKGGLNTYAYCSGDPVSRSDPSGRFWGVNVKSLVISFMGLLSIGASTMPAVGFRESFIAIKRGVPTLDHVVKVGTTTAAFMSSGAATARASLLEPESVLGDALHWLSTTTAVASLTGNALIATRDFLRRRAARGLETLPDLEVQNTLSRNSFELESIQVVSRTSLTGNYLRSPSPLDDVAQIRRTS